MNYFDELRKQKDKDEDFYKYLENYSDYTYLCFRKFVLERLPKLIEDAFLKGGNSISFSFKVPSQIRVGMVQDVIFENGKKRAILINEFLEYMMSIPGIYVSKPEYNVFKIQGSLENFIKYYYEELQSEEYAISR